jgi:hypothetical protein
MDQVLQRRRAAHIHAAREHQRTAEFYGRVAQLFDSIGPDSLGVDARRVAEEQGQRAQREWWHADRIT